MDSTLMTLLDQYHAFMSSDAFLNASKYPQSRRELYPSKN